jgi:hypothetical protein
MKYLGSTILVLALWLGAQAGVRAEPAPPVEPGPTPSVETDVETDVETEAGPKLSPELPPELAIDVALHGPIPFHLAELQDALLPRLDEASIDTRAAARGAAVEVSATAGGVLVRVGGRERTLSLGTRTGPGAARVVALVVLDLLLSEGPALPMPLAMPAADQAVEIMADTTAAPHAATAPPVTTAPPMTAPPATTAAPVPAPAATVQPRRPRSLAFEPPPPPPAPTAAAAEFASQQLGPPGRSDRPAPELVTRPAPRRGSGSGAASSRAVTQVRLSGFGGAALGPTSERTAMVSAGADVRLGRGSWRAGVGLSWLHLPMTSYAQTDIGLDGASVRLDVGRALGDLELTAGAFAMPSRLYTDVSDAPRDHHDSLLYGGAAAMRAGVRLGRRWLLVSTAGVDVFGRRLRVRTPDEVITSTPLVTISLTVGVSWEAMP